MTLDQVKTGLSLMGILIAVIGIALGSRLLAWIALGVLGGAMVLRVVIRRINTSAPADTDS